MPPDPSSRTLFTAVILGVFDEAIAVAREQISTKAGQLRSYEQVEWSRAELEHWVAVQAYEGALRAIEGAIPASRSTPLCAARKRWPTSRR